MHEIERRLAAAGQPTVTTASLKVYISEWENSRRAVGPEYRAVLREVFGQTDGELFAVDPEHELPSLDEAYTELADRIETATAIDLLMIDTLVQQTELFRRMDRQLGAAILVDRMNAHLATLENALAYAVLPTARRPVAEVLASASTLAGWQALDVGAVDRAWRHYETARRAAAEAENPALLAHAMGEQAYVLVDAGRANLAVQLIREARKSAHGKSPARLLAWLAAAEAEMSAISGDDSACRAALDQASAALPSGAESRDADVPGVFLNESHLARWRGNALAQLGDAGALADLHSALDRLDPTFARAQAGLRIDLGQAYYTSGELGEARRQAGQARMLVNRTGSLRHRRRLDHLTLSLTKAN
ncbi:XRE family transcriptional regulator [Micromonospora sp. NPDC049523]|uniref:XRE family transcriptional regulator n=1 Tax=Micromonospora sp. NPDC049523 TaxID=3155921 RepID=UPI003441FFC7